MKTKTNYPRLVFLLLILGLCIVFTIKTRIYNVCGYSMYPTINHQDVGLVYVTQDIDYGDVVIIAYEDIYLCKRVVGLPGDTVLITDSCIHVNQNRLDEPYLPPWSKHNKFIKTCTLKSDEIFVMGDNRLYSLDSRHLGPLKKNKVVGKMVFTLFRRL